MRCPQCNEPDNFTTIDSRPREWGIKRRKRCLNCNKTFATIEIYQFSHEAFTSLGLNKRLIEMRQKERTEK